MTADRNAKLAELIAQTTGAPEARIVENKSCSGGCIHRAELVRLDNGELYFVKSSPAAGDMFAQEACGLAAIAQTESLRTPQIVAAGKLLENEACLVLEAIQPAAPKPSFWQEFGRLFASLHRPRNATCFGWSSDNYLGSSRQINESRENWTAFFAECRLQFQMRLARKNGLGSRELFKLMDRLIEKLPKHLDHANEAPSLLHGDLWSGNFLVDAQGGPVVIDPAVYYGHREADLAMPLLFGGFSADFFSAYHESFPLREGWQERVELYKLYHLLNHLNLFGSGYLESCLEIARRFA